MDWDDRYKNNLHSLLGFPFKIKFQTEKIWRICIFSAKKRFSTRKVTGNACCDKIYIQLRHCWSDSLWCFTGNDSALWNLLEKIANIRVWSDNNWLCIPEKFFRSRKNINGIIKNFFPFPCVGDSYWKKPTHFLNNLELGLPFSVALSPSTIIILPSHNPTTLASFNIWNSLMRSSRVSPLCSLLGSASKKCGFMLNGTKFKASNLPKYRNNEKQFEKTENPRQWQKRQQQICRVAGVDTYVGGKIIGISFVVAIETVAMFVPALDPIYGIPSTKTRFRSTSTKLRSYSFFNKTNELPPPI